MFFVTLIKNKNGGKLTNEALSHEGRSPSEHIKSNQSDIGKKNGIDSLVHAVCGLPKTRKT